MAIGEGWELSAEAEQAQAFHWFRVSPRAALEVAVLSDAPVWYTGHFVEGRMWPCAGEGCRLCAEGIGTQVRFVLAVCELSTRRVGLLEMGRSNGLAVRDWCGRNGGLKGMVLEFYKHSKASTSRTEVSYIDRLPPPWVYAMPVPEVRKALVNTWVKAKMPVPKGLGV